MVNGVLKIISGVVLLIVFVKFQLKMKMNVLARYLENINVVKVVKFGTLMNKAIGVLKIMIGVPLNIHVPNKTRIVIYNAVEGYFKYDIIFNCSQ